MQNAEAVSPNIDFQGLESQIAELRAQMAAADQ